MANYREDALQKAVARYLDLKNVLWSHIALERSVSAKTGGNLKKKGVKKGIPDCLIFESCNGYHGLAIELKVEGGSIKPHQKQWIDDLKNRGWRAIVCWSLDDAIDEIDYYLK